MRVISRKTLVDFWTLHPTSEGPLTAWYALTAAANWAGPADVRQTFGSADFIPDSRVVFNVGGNNFRVICRLDYTYKIVFIKFVGTHADYDRVHADKVGNPNEKQERKR
ncbi:MAG: type II toxin-antitoxin system HigB family toxin [Rhodospirillales bacterium]|nr:type II toxin-antitoxin system HigB family toxin [Acetobacter sp.]